ncbi:unnamed protein product [Schistosoma rodhaini]|nr:unnamed protein product [Schistosoma rodhaini]
MLNPDELDAIEKLNELCEKEEKLNKQSIKKNHKTHHHHHDEHQHQPHHHHHHHHSNNNNNNLSSIFHCSETRTIKSTNSLNNTTTNNTTDNNTTNNSNNTTNNSNDNNNNNHLIPTGLPRIQTKISIKILNTNCCITIKLDPTTIMNTVKAMYNLNEQIIIIGYQRLIILNTLEQLPITFNGIIEQNDHFNYNLITYIEHKYKINLNMYYLNSTRETNISCNNI